MIIFRGKVEESVHFEIGSKTLNMVLQQGKTKKVKTVFRQYCNLIIPTLIEKIGHEISSNRKGLWARPWLLRRDVSGATAILLKESETEDLGEYRSLLRLGLEKYDSLVKAITPKIIKHCVASSYSSKSEITSHFMFSCNRSWLSLFTIFLRSIPTSYN